MTTTPTARFEHLLSSRALIGWGAPVATARPVASPLYEFGGGYPDPASFPYDDMVETTARMMKAEGAQALTYGDPQGYRGLRELVCHKYRVFEGLEVTPENIFVANGSGHALSLVFSAFVDPGDPIICEAPTFSGSLNNIRRHGPEILDAPVDADGMVTRVVRERLEGLKRQGRRCKLIYTIVNFQNPAGPDLSLRRRQELVQLAEEHDTFILEDDAYGELRFEGEPKPPVYALDRSGRVIRAGTLSKILGAGVRLGWLCAPRAMLPAFQGFNFGGGVNPFMSRVATWYLRDHMEEHVKALDRRLSRQARRHAPGALGGARVHRRRDQPPRGRVLHLDQAPGQDRLCAIGGVGGGGAGSVHAGARVLPERRRRALHPPGLQLRAAGEVLRGRSAHRARDPRRAAVTRAPRRALQTERLRCPSVGSRSASCCGPRPVRATRPYDCSLSNSGSSRRPSAAAAIRVMRCSQRQGLTTCRI